LGGKGGTLQNNGKRREGGEEKKTVWEGGKENVGLAGEEWKFTKRAVQILSGGKRARTSGKRRGGTD